MPSLFSADPNVYMNAVDNPQDNIVKDKVSAEMRKIYQDMTSALTSLSEEASRTSSDLSKVGKALEDTKQYTVRFNELSKALDNMAGTSLREVQFLFNEATKRAKVYEAFYKTSEARKESLRRKQLAREEADQKRLHAQFAKNNKDLLDSISAGMNSSTSDVIQALESMKNTTDNYNKTSGRLQSLAQLKILSKQKEALDDRIASYEEYYNILEQYSDDYTEDELKEARERLAIWKNQSKVYTEYIRSESEATAKQFGTAGETVMKSLKGIESGFNSFKDVLDSINLHNLTQAITQGAESSIDIMSQAAQARGMAYSTIRGQKSGFNGADTYGGMIGGADIMSVYQMNRLSNEYLADMANEIAMFSKETSLSNQALEGMYTWAQNTGINRGRTLSVLDALQGIRDDGADLQSIADIINAHPALLQGREKEAASALALTQKYGMKEVEDIIAQGINDGNSLYKILSSNEGYGRLLTKANFSEVESLMNSQRYEEVAMKLIEASKKVAEEASTSGYGVEYNKRGEMFGLSAETMAKLGGENSLNMDQMEEYLKKVREDMSTVASNAESAGFVDAITKMENKASVGIAGDATQSFVEFTKNHPITVALAGSVFSKLAKGAGEALLKGKGSDLLKGGGDLFGKLFGKGVKATAEGGADMAQAAGEGGAKLAEGAAQGTGLISKLTTFNPVTTLIGVGIDLVGALGKTTEAFSESEPTWEEIGDVGESWGKVLGSSLGALAGPLGMIAGSLVGGAVGKLSAQSQPTNQETDLNNAYVNVPVGMDPEFYYKSIGLNPDGTHAIGLPYVPYDGYLAELHRGERVITAAENKDYYQDRFDSGVYTPYLEQIISLLTLMANNKDLTKVLKDGFEYVARSSALERGSSNIIESGSNAYLMSGDRSLTGQYLRNEWG